MTEAAPPTAGASRMTRPDDDGRNPDDALGAQAAEATGGTAQVPEDPVQPLASYDRDEAERDLAALTRDFSGDYDFGYDREGWYAWPFVPHRDDLTAGTPGELRVKVEAALGRAVQ